MRRGLALIFAFLAVLLTAPPANADHHFVKIREYYPGLLATANDGFLELQLYATGQNLVSGHDIYLYDSTDTPPEPSMHTLNPSTPDPANGENQRTILIAGTSEPVVSDYPENFTYDPLGGALCFVSTEGFGEVDCVEWGVGDPAVAAGNPAAPAGIPDGQSLNRSITPGCATLLEAGDDSNDSAADFALAAPSPRNNAVAPTETACSGPGPGGGGGGDANPPETTITKQPKAKSAKAKAKFSFESNEPGSSFMCKLDKAAFKSCSSPFKKRVGIGRHRFRVFAIDGAGNEDKSPAKAKFKRVEG